MHVDVKMPDLATTESEITVTRWLVAVGDAVSRGQPLLEVETDKAAMEVEAYLAGRLSEIVVHPGDTVEAGQVIARLAVEAVPERGRQTPATQPGAAATPASVSPTAAPELGRSKGGFFARNRQRAASAPAPSPAAPGTAAPAAMALGVAARAAARRLAESKQTIPHFYLQMSANAEAMQARRRAALPRRLAWDAFFVQALALALKDFPKLACRWDDGRLLPPETDGIGVAVDLDDELFVASVPGASTATLEGISDRIRAEVERLRRPGPDTRRIAPNLMTITNLGADGVDAFAAIINPPEAAVLAIGRVAPAVVAVAGTAVVQERVTLTLSVDHRVANGRYAAAFLGRIVALLEAIEP